MDSAQSLKDSGLKATLPRRRILELFEASKVRHLSAEDVYRALLAEGLDVGIATVYRELTQFEPTGLRSRQHFETGKAVYELNQGGRATDGRCGAGRWQGRGRTVRNNSRAARPDHRPSPGGSGRDRRRQHRSVLRAETPRGYRGGWLST